MQNCLEVIKKAVSLHRFSKVIELWCNGNTADFGSVILGSNPGSSTQKTPGGRLGLGVFFVLERVPSARRRCEVRMLSGGIVRPSGSSSCPKGSLAVLN